jgi:hypothetical protein
MSKEGAPNPAESWKNAWEEKGVTPEVIAVLKEAETIAIKDGDRESIAQLRKVLDPYEKGDIPPPDHSIETVQKYID